MEEEGCCLRKKTNRKNETRAPSSESHGRRLTKGRPSRSPAHRSISGTTLTHSHAKTRPTAGGEGGRSSGSLECGYDDDGEGNSLVDSRERRCRPRCCCSCCSCTPDRKGGRRGRGRQAAPLRLQQRRSSPFFFDGRPPFGDPSSCRRRRPPAPYFRARAFLPRRRRRKRQRERLFPPGLRRLLAGIRAEMGRRRARARHPAPWRQAPQGGGALGAVSFFLFFLFSFFFSLSLSRDPSPAHENFYFKKSKTVRPRSPASPLPSAASVAPCAAPGSRRRPTSPPPSAPTSPGCLSEKRVATEKEKKRDKACSRASSPRRPPTTKSSSSTPRRLRCRWRAQRSPPGCSR